MLKTQLTIRSSEGPSFGCYLAMPQAGGKLPAIVLACSIRGVDEDLRRIADEFAANGCIAAAPDLFWRTVPGPLESSDPRMAARGQPRLEKIRTGERDLLDVLSMLKGLPTFNGRAAVMGFCYGGPYAILGPRKLGFDAGISCHGSQMLDFIGELEGMRQPVCIIWGDRDSMAPADVLDAYRSAATRLGNVELHVLPGVQHGYMMRGKPEVFDAQAYDFSMRRALAIVEAMAQSAPALQGIDHIHVFVRDRAAAEAWYRDVMGFSRVEEYASWAAGGGPLTVADASGTVHLALFERPPAPCRTVIAMRVDAAGLIAWRRHLESHGVAVTTQDHDQSVSLYFTDPDGNPYEITTYELPLDCGSSPQ